MLKYCNTPLSAGQIALHLRDCDHAFIPALSSRVDIDHYATKLATHATCFSAWQGDELAGIAAIYCNREPVSFLSSLSVLPNAQRNGIATQLMAECIAYAVQCGFKTLALEVNETNLPAITFYKKHGFAVRNMQNGTVDMHRTLS